MNIIAGADPKRIHRVLFGVAYEEDIYERFCGAFPKAMRVFWWRMNRQMRRRNLIFIHVPRAGGTSISRALFGPGNTLHHSVRYYRTIHPRFFHQAESFAVLRDPFEHFASAYAFVRAGGTASCRLSDLFAAETAHIGSVDDYLSYLEARDVLALDFVMRPQSWFVCDLGSGLPLVKKLFLLNEDRIGLMRFLRGQGIANLPRLNASERVPLLLTRRQRARIERLYAADFALVAALRRDIGLRMAAE